MNAVDVVVVGGGVVGTSAAYHLAAAGAGSVLLLEREDTLGTGSTGRCAGGFRHQFSSEVNVRLSIESIRMIVSFQETHGLPLDVDRDGYLFLVRDQAEWREFLAGVELQRSLGVDTRVFRPRGQPRVPGRIVAVASADSPIKGTGTLLRAVGKLVTDTDARLIIVGKPAPATRRLAAQLSLADRVTFTHGLSDEAFSALLASAETAVVPSLYEGFSLPAVEHMASGTPLVASRTGALPEVTGDAAVLVTPGEDEELAAVLRRLHHSPAERDALADRALRRVRERFAWPAVAQATVGQYLAAMEGPASTNRTGTKGLAEC